MKKIRQHTFYNTYYYANAVSSILSQDIETVGFISNFFSFDEVVLSLANPFEKYSAFHRFIEYMIGDFFDSDMHENDQRIYNYWHINGHLDPLYDDTAFSNYKISYSFEEYLAEKPLTSYDQVSGYHEEIQTSGLLEELYEKITHEVFYILFNNRLALLLFNDIASGQLRDVRLSDLADNPETHTLFSADGVLRRVTVPQWVRKAVFHRDSGRCCACGTDLTSLFNNETTLHYDHILPLANSGINDVSNIQLLCSGCNIRKSNREIVAGDQYQLWY